METKWGVKNWSRYPKFPFWAGNPVLPKPYPYPLVSSAGYTGIWLKIDYANVAGIKFYYPAYSDSTRYQNSIYDSLVILNFGWAYF